MMNFVYVDGGGMMVAIPCQAQQKRDDGALSHGPSKMEEYRKKTQTKPLDLYRSKRDLVFLFRNLL